MNDTLTITYKINKILLFFILLLFILMAQQNSNKQLCSRIIQLMLDNFLEQEYHSYDQVYTHPTTKTHIYIGDFQAAADKEFHKNCRIKTIVTAAVNMEHIQIDSSIKRIIYPLLDSKSENITSFFQRFFDVIESHAPLGNILVHCSAGISRSSTLVISYIMKKQKMTFKQAIAIVRKARPKVLPNLGFERQLKKYEDALRKVNTKSQRVPRRIEVRTSESGKSQRSIRVDLFPFDEALVNREIQYGNNSDKIRRCIDQLHQKGIHVPKSYNGRNCMRYKGRELSRNRIILAEKLKKLHPLKNQRTLKTELFQPQQGNLLDFLRIQNKRVLKSKTITSQVPYIESYKHIEPIKKHLSEYRKNSLINNVKPFQKE